MVNDPITFDATELEAMLDSGQVEFKNGQPVVVGPLAAEAIVRDVDTAVFYDTRTGVSSEVRVYDGNNTLARMLSKRDPITNKRIFTSSRPAITPPVADHPCWLNPKSERYAEFRAMGMATCKGESLASEQDVLLHMRNKHRNDWRRIEEMDRQRKEDEDRAANREMLQAMLALARRDQSPTVEEMQRDAMKGLVAQIEAEAHEAIARADKQAYGCDLCEFVGASEQGLKIHVGRNHKEP